MSDHDWVRRLLADAGQSPEPMPPEVAERLDRMLDELDAETGSRGPAPTRPLEPTGSAVVPMTRRRQRRWAGAVFAAAAVTLGGYTLTATGALDGLAGGAESASSADSAGGEALADEQGPEAGAAGSGAGSDTESDTESAEERRLTRDLAAGKPAALSSATLRRDVARLVTAGALRPSQGASRDTTDQDSIEAPSTARTGGCVPPPAVERGSRVAVTYDGRPATAVLRRAPGGGADVQLWDCESPTRLARVVVRR